MKIELFLGGGGSNWYWRMRARNGRIVTYGAEAYATRQSCKRAVLSVLSSLGAGVTFVTVKLY